MSHIKALGRCGLAPVEMEQAPTKCLVMYPQRFLEFFLELHIRLRKFYAKNFLISRIILYSQFLDKNNSKNRSKNNCVHRLDQV